MVVKVGYNTFMAQTLHPVGTRVAFYCTARGKVHPLNGSVATVVESRLHIANGKKYFKYKISGNATAPDLPLITFELNCEDGEAGVRIEPVRTAGGVVTGVGDEDVSFQDGWCNKFRLNYARLANYGITKADLYEGKLVTITSTVELPRAVNVSLSLDI